MTSAEEYFVDYLNARFPDAPAYGDEPQDAPPSFLTVEQVGGGVADKIPHASVAVQSWAGSRDEASQLNLRVIEAMLQAPEQPEISRCALDDTYNFTDTTKKRYRYQAVFEVVHFLF